MLLEADKKLDRIRRVGIVGQVIKCQGMLGVEESCWIRAYGNKLSAKNSRG